MKNGVVILMFVSINGFAQIQTTTGSGNFFNPLLWDCLCVPANGDTLVINHDMEMTASIYYTTGKITIDYNGSLTEDGNNRDVWVDGGSLWNFGTFDCYRLYISDGSFYNAGTSVYFDSLFNQASISNTGSITAYDFLNDQTGSFNNSSNVIIENNFNNQGYFFNNGNIEVGNDFSNCNIQTMDAMFKNFGVFCVAEDFANCLDDTLSGNGEYFVGGDALNAGSMDGDFDFNHTGTFTQTGFLATSVTLGSATCYLSMPEADKQLSIYPNPAKDLIYISESNLIYQITDLSGKIISTGRTSTNGIDISTYKSGVYTIQIQMLDGTLSNSKFVKL